MGEHTPRKVIAIDIDLVLCNVIPKWHIYLKSLCSNYDAGRYKKDLLYGDVDYDIAKYYTLPEGIDGFDFWDQQDLYDDVPLYPNAQDVIRELYKKYDIVFVSYSVAGHLNSKVNFVKGNFTFIPEEDFHFISTKSKGHVRCDIIIDDRHCFINQMPDEVKCIKFSTEYSQCEPLKRSAMHVNNWNDIANLMQI